MPKVLESIDKMSVLEKMSTMEYIWNELQANYSEAAPAWHRDVLEARRRRIESGAARFLTMEEAEARLEQECHAR